MMSEIEKQRDSSSFDVWFRVGSAMITALAGLLVSQNGLAATSVLKKIEVVHPRQIDLTFDTRVDLAKVKLEAFNDILQLSLEDAAVYPAKITPIPGEELKKVFAYQYSPKLVRARFTVEGKAASLQSRVKLTPRGKVLSFTLEDESAVLGTGFKDEISRTSAQALRVEKEVKMPVKETEYSPAQKKLLDQVTRTGGASTKKVSPPNKKTVQPTQLTSSRPLPSPWKVISGLIAVLGVFLIGILLFKKWKGLSGSQSQFQFGKLGLSSQGGQGGMIADLVRKWSGPISKIGGKKAGAKTIEVIATHYLGPKNSIAIVKIGDSEMVLGVTPESMNLITTLNSSEDSSEKSLSERSMDDGPTMNSQMAPFTMGSGAQSAGEPSFSDVLQREGQRPSVRNQIRNRLEGFKRL